MCKKKYRTGTEILTKCYVNSFKFAVLPDEIYERQMKTMKPFNWIIIAGLIVAAAISRLIPHPFNFSPVAGMALFAGATMGKKAWAFILPLGALFLSDLCFQLFTAVPGFYGWSQLINYGAFALIVCVGILALKKVNVKNVLVTSLGASILFFVLSNFGVWLVAGGIAPYTADGAGLLNTFLLGIPFFGNTILGDMISCGVLFGAYHLIQQLAASRKRLVA